MVKDFHVFHYSANRRAYGHQSVQLGGYTIWWGDPAEYGDVVYLGGIFMFLIGGLTGIPLALPAFDINVHDSAFIVGHFHYVLGMAMTLGL